MWALLNFFENSRRYLQLKVQHRCLWHRWQGENIFNQKSFNYFVWTQLESRVNLFVFKFTLRSRQPTIVPIICHRCHWHQWQICCRWWWYQWQIATVSFTQAANLPPVSLTLVENLPPVSTTLAKLVANMPPVSLIPVVHTLNCECLREFSKKFETVQMGYSGTLEGG